MIVDHILFYLIAYPGILFTSILGLFLLWVSRKLIARFQWRIGPPFYQCFADFFKLLFKETVVPERANRFAFLSAPLLSFAAVTIAMLLIPIGSTWSFLGFMGDNIVLVYLLVIPELAMIIGGSSSGNPFGAIGSGRGANLLFAYELVVVLSVLTPCVDAGSLMLSEVAKQFYLFKYPLAAIAFFFSMQAKLCMVPFDIPEAKTEIMAGPYTEYSGAPLGFFKLVHGMLLVALPSFMIALFFPGPFTGLYLLDVLIHVLKCTILVVLASILVVLNPRMRIDQSLKFFGFLAILASVDFGRAILYAGVL